MRYLNVQIEAIPSTNNIYVSFYTVKITGWVVCAPTLGIKQRFLCFNHLFSFELHLENLTNVLSIV